MPLSLNQDIAILGLLTGIFFTISYGINIKKTYDENPRFIYLSVLYFIGAFSYLVYASFILFKSFKSVSTC